MLDVLGEPDDIFCVSESASFVDEDIYMYDNLNGSGMDIDVFVDAEGVVVLIEVRRSR